MREALAVLDEVASLGSGLGAAADDLLRIARALGDAAGGCAASEGTGFVADLGGEVLVLSARFRELAEATARSHRAFAAADLVRAPAVTGRPPVRATVRRDAGPPLRPLPTTLPADPVSAVVAVARSQVGYREGPRNATVFGAWAGAPNAAWCASFVSWAFFTAGRRLPSVDVKRGFVGVGNGRRWAMRNGRSFREPRVGDIVTTLRSDGRGHTGIVVALLPGGRIRTVEGNTTARGGREGVMVAERTRRLTSGMRFWRP
jgi:hypothetical protein